MGSWQPSGCIGSDETIQTKGSVVQVFIQRPDDVTCNWVGDDEEYSSSCHIWKPGLLLPVIHSLHCIFLRSVCKLKDTITSDAASIWKEIVMKFNTTSVGFGLWNNSNFSFQQIFSQNLWKENVRGVSTLLTLFNVIPETVPELLTIVPQCSLIVNFERVCNIILINILHHGCIVQYHVEQVFTWYYTLCLRCWLWSHTDGQSVSNSETVPRVRTEQCFHPVLTMFYVIGYWGWLMLDVIEFELTRIQH